MRNALMATTAGLALLAGCGTIPSLDELILKPRAEIRM